MTGPATPPTRTNPSVDASSIEGILPDRSAARTCFAGSFSTFLPVGAASCRSRDEMSRFRGSTSVVLIILCTQRRLHLFRRHCLGQIVALPAFTPQFEECVDELWGGDTFGDHLETEDAGQ